MRSSSGFRPSQGTHVQRSELCGTCHTLITQALGPQGQVLGELPEQVPYQEWLHSAYKDTKSCQDCHMPAVEQEAPIAAVLGQPRPGVSRHTFAGGNFLMPRLLNRFRLELGVAALPQEQESAALRAMAHLQTEAARVSIARAGQRGGRVEAEISVENLGGHKLPTAYPSRRAWLHVVVRDREGKTVFESGALNKDGSIRGNDNDAGAAQYEPHFTVIEKPDQVQIYEDIMADPAGAPTTGLLTAVRYLKDNRLLPRGFDKSTAGKDVAVIGGAAEDADFSAGGDRVLYSVPVGGARGPFQVDVELWYQPIGYRWAVNLRQYDAPEPRRFSGYWEEMAPASGAVLARASTR
jgi:hypothetical protein